MKKTWVFLLLLIIFFTRQYAQADTEVSGNITVDTTWTMANSPYIVTSTVQILEGLRLTIESGVIIKFDQGTGLNVGGELVAAGTEQDLITFTSNQSDPSPGDWDGIRFVSTALGADFDEEYNYLSGSIIEYCDIEFGTDIVLIPFSYLSYNRIDNCKTIIISRDSYFSHNAVTNNSEYGIEVHGSRCYIAHCSIVNNYISGIRLLSGDNIVSYNIVTNHDSYGNCAGLEVWGYRNEISYNTITNNNNGILFGEREDTSSITHNNLHGNYLYALNMKMDTDPNVPHNYWGTTDTSMVDERIFDYYDDITKGKVNYDPIATQPFKSADFSGLPLSGPRPLDVTFTNNSMGVINSVIWDFGDGETSTSLNPTHTYYTLGTFTVSSSVTTPEGTFSENKIDYITVSNVSPTANAGPVQTVDEGITVTLDGSNSTDPDNGIASYLWNQIDGNQVTLSDANSVQPSFTAPDVGPDGASLTFQLIVTDNGGLQATDTCIVNVSWLNIPPSANAGPDQMVDEGSTVALDGSNSTDPDNGIASYLWEQQAGPSMTLSDISAVNPTFTAPEVTSDGVSLTFQLTVTDQGGLQSTDTCIVNITWSNNPPIADAGPDQTVDEGEIRTLNASNSTDTDDGIAAYLWEQQAGPSVSLSDTSAVNPIFTAPEVTLDGVSLTFQLIVTDQGGLQSTDTCIVNITWSNNPPIADAGPDQTVDEGVTITIDASNSTDTDDGIAAYLWEQQAGPSMTLSDTSAVNPIFTASEVTSDGVSLTFQLTVTDAGGLQSTDTCIVNITWSNNPPIADAGPDQTVDEGETVTIDASNSTDTDDGIASYLWEQQAGPSVILSDINDKNPTFVAPSVDGDDLTLKFQLMVRDEGGLQSSDIINIKVSDNGISIFPNNVITFSSVTNKDMGININDGGNLIKLNTISSEDIDDTDDKPQDLIYGLIDLEIKVNTPGETVTVIIYLPAPAPNNYKWFKYSVGIGWYDFSDYTAFNTTRDIVTFTFTDGGPGDDDGIPNGVIKDPLGLGIEALDESTPNNSSGGGGCFIITTVINLLN